MNNTYHCQSCAAPIPLEDINVATDIALCRRCGATSSFASIRTLSDASALLSKPPPKGVKVERDMMGYGSIITYRRIPIGLLLFVIPFTAGWSGFSMIGIYGSQIAKGEFNLLQSLFGIPFLFGTIALVSIILFGLFGKWTIRLNRGDGTVFVGVGMLGWKRKFTYTTFSTVRLEDSAITDDRQRTQVIAIKTDNTEFSFGSSLKKDVQKFITATLMREFRH